MPLESTHNDTHVSLRNSIRFFKSANFDRTSFSWASSLEKNATFVILSRWETILLFVFFLNCTIAFEPEIRTFFVD